MMALLSVLPAAKAQDHDFSNMEKEYPLLMQRYGDRLVYLVLQTGMVSGSMIRNRSSTKRMRGRNISYDTPNPGMSNNVGAFSLPKIWKFIFYMSMAETGRYGGNKLHIPRRNHGAAVSLRSVLVLS